MVVAGEGGVGMVLESSVIDIFLVGHRMSYVRHDGKQCDIQTLRI